MSKSEIVHEGKKYEAKEINGEMCFVPIKERTPGVGDLYKLSGPIWMLVQVKYEKFTTMNTQSKHLDSDSNWRNSPQEVHDLMMTYGYKVVGTANISSNPI